MVPVYINRRIKEQMSEEEREAVTVPMLVWVVLSIVALLILLFVLIPMLEGSYLIDLLTRIGPSIYPSQPTIGWGIFIGAVSFIILAPLYIKKRFGKNE